MKVSILCSSLSHQPFGRAALLGLILQRSYEVEIIGPAYDGQVWSPWSDAGVPVKRVNVPEKRRNFPYFWSVLRNMYRMIDGDVVYAVKSRLPSYLPALLAKYIKGLPLVLDLDDWESAHYRGDGLFAQSGKELLLSPESLLYTRLSERLIGCADEITVASTFLRQRSGRGTIVVHARDTDKFDPDNFDSRAIKEKLGWLGLITIIYLGTPTSRVPFLDIVEAMELLEMGNLKLVIVGVNRESEVCRQIAPNHRDRIIFQERVKFADAPRYLSAADMVVLPFRDSPAMRANIPAKLFDSMAMAKPIIAAGVSDIPEILKDCGLVYRPGDIRELAGNIKWVIDHYDQAREMGMRAREKCVKLYSLDAVGGILDGVLGKYE